MARYLRLVPLFILGVTVFCNELVFVTEALSDTNTRITNPSAVSVELAGRGLLYSLNFDRAVNDDWVAGIGFGTVSVNNPNGSSAGVSTAIIPVYLNFYLSQDAGSLYVTGGANWVTNASQLSGLTSSLGGIQFSTSPIQLTFGLGYELRSDPGFLFRVAAYGIYAMNLSPWGGITVGYSF